MYITMFPMVSNKTSITRSRLRTEAARPLHKHQIDSSKKQRQGQIILSHHNIKSINKAAKAIAEGEVVGFPICGVMGLVCDGSNSIAIKKIFKIKGRDISRSLIIAANATLREKMIDKQKLHPNLKDIDWNNVYNLPTFVIFPSQAWISDQVSINVPNYGKTIAVFWANYYQPFIQLEQAFLRLKPNSFLVGSSANKSGQPSLVTAKELAKSFAGQLKFVIEDSEYENFGSTKGTHTMLSALEEQVKPHRSGAVHMASYEKILGNKLEILPTWVDQINAVVLDVDLVKNTGHYLKKLVQKKYEV